MSTELLSTPSSFEHPGVRTAVQLLSVGMARVEAVAALRQHERLSLPVAVAAVMEAVRLREMRD
jgi:hypothetical protein